ncbi:hypothetical protein D0T53_08665 [Dysgonomonas sp. 216]|uniref:hypothetical protein n=1 Tax=Dysgonomonas sp. 216 TaxID=2302934 RepID=UPI0013D7626E|nr:hypothetical protein [Dysgonomonas sp. 216]NDW18981.1 hypothetical protein [Dysgonomonas sp. 216]
MDKTIRTLITLFIVCFPFSINGQSSISEKDKKELEERFSSLKTFYIDDDGAVVFYTDQDQPKENDPEQTKKEEKAATPRLKVKVTQDENGEYIVTSNEGEIEHTAKSIPIKREVASEESTQSEADTATQNETSGNNKSEKTSSGLTYKTLEEARLAVEAKMEELKKQYSQRSPKTNSFGNRISNGVDGSLRNNSITIKQSRNKQSDTDLMAEYGNEPTYYINGNVSDAEVVRKLKQKDIIKKELKRSSKNPNGEIWIEVR